MNNPSNCKYGIQYNHELFSQAGSDSFKSITRSYYRGAIGGLLVFDYGRLETFRNIQKWLKEI